MRWERIKYKSQIEAIQKGSILLKYPQMIIIPDELTNENTGEVFNVTDVTGIAGGVRISMLHAKEDSVKTMFENAFPSVVDSDALIREAWFVRAI